MLIPVTTTLRLPIKKITFEIQSLTFILFNKDICERFDFDIVN